MTRRLNSLAPIIGAILLAVVSTTLVAFALIDYFRTRAEAVNQLAVQAETSAAQLASGLAIPIWNVDPPQIVRNIEALMRDPKIATVSLATPERAYNFSRDAAGNPVQVDLLPSIEANAIALELPVEFAGRTIATLAVSASTHLLESQLESSLRQNIFGFLLVDLILVYALYVSLRILVINPLESIESYAASISSNTNPDAIPPLRDIRFVGELQTLRDSLNQTLGLLHSRYLELQASKERLQLATRAGLIGVWDWDIATNTLSWDESMYTLYGIDKKDFSGEFDA